MFHDGTIRDYTEKSINLMATIIRNKGVAVDTDFSDGVLNTNKHPTNPLVEMSAARTHLDGLGGYRRWDDGYDVRADARLVNGERAELTVSATTDEMDSHLSFMKGLPDLAASDVTVRGVAGEDRPPSEIELRRGGATGSSSPTGIRYIGTGADEEVRIQGYPGKDHHVVEADDVETVARAMEENPSALIAVKVKSGNSMDYTMSEDQQRGIEMPYHSRAALTTPAKEPFLELAELADKSF